MRLYRVSSWPEDFQPAPLCLHEAEFFIKHLPPEQTGEDFF